MKAIQFKVTIKKLKEGINKEVKGLQDENYKTLMKEISENTQTKLEDL